jgi:hypothetical protein
MPTTINPRSAEAPFVGAYARIVVAIRKSLAGWIFHVMAFHVADRPFRDADCVASRCRFEACGVPQTQETRPERVICHVPVIPRALAIP